MGQRCTILNLVMEVPKGVGICMRSPPHAPFPARPLAGDYNVLFKWRDVQAVQMCKGASVTKRAMCSGRLKGCAREVTAILSQCTRENIRQNKNSSEESRGNSMCSSRLLKASPSPDVTGERAMFCSMQAAMPASVYSTRWSALPKCEDGLLVG
jgi:hypothetical protein